MLIWLPPSEGKTAPYHGPSLRLETLLLPDLADARLEVIGALRDLGDGPNAAQVLGLGKKSSEEAALNLQLETSPCAPAIDLYTGVLFDNLNARTLGARGGRLLANATWIMSALFGFVRTTDLIPNHRLAMGLKLPPLDSLAAWWRKQLSASVPPLDGTAIFDCRPGAYRNAYPAAEADVIELAVVEERRCGRKVITHMAKKWRGLAVRHLVEDPAADLNSSYEDVLNSLACLAKTQANHGVLAIEIADAARTRAGGSTTRVTLVTRSTEMN